MTESGPSKVIVSEYLENDLQDCIHCVKSVMCNKSACQFVNDVLIDF